MADWWSRNRKRLLRLAGTLLATGLLVFLLEEEGWGEISLAMQQVTSEDLAIVAVLFIISRFATMGRWHVLLRSGKVRIPFKDTVALTFTGLFASNFLPTTIGGDVIRLAGAMQMGFDQAVCLASLAVDRLIGMLGMSMTLPIGLVASWNTLVAGPLQAVTVPVLAKRLMEFLKRTLHTFQIWIRQPLSLIIALGFTWIHMLCLFGSIYILVDGLGGRLSFWLVAGLWSLTYFITLIPISINGYGVQELSFTFFLSRVGGLSTAASLTVAVLIRAFFMLSSLPGAAFLPSILSSMGREQSGQEHPKI